MGHDRHRHKGPVNTFCRYCGKFIPCRRRDKVTGRGTWCDEHRLNYQNETDRLSHARVRARKKREEAERLAGITLAQ
jgi:hypothetical protein